VREVREEERGWVKGFLEEHWGSSAIVTRGRVHRGEELPGFVAESGGERIGLVTFRIEERECEVISLNSLRERAGVGSALLSSAENEARRAECARFFLITTNDNFPAIRFYKRRGFFVRAVRRDALDGSRRLKPSIPRVGFYGLPLRHEVEMELPLARSGRDFGKNLVPRAGPIG
jgi:ribosomal protein S18 acetylase RimI-like enzyme